MRFMLILYPGPRAEKPGALPDERYIAAAMRFNEELARSGALLALDGLHPSSEGARVRYGAGGPEVIDGPFPTLRVGPESTPADTGGIAGGYWMIQARSKEEAVAWAQKAPAEEGQVVEVRRVFEMNGFVPDPEGWATELSSRIRKELGTRRSKGR